MGKRFNAQEHDIVLRVRPDVFQIMIRMGFVYTDYQRVNVYEKIFIRQCQGCLQFNPDHGRNECDQSICAKCGTKDINAQHTCDTLKCHNCSSHRNQGLKDNADHRANTTKCPLYEAQVRRLASRICYDVPELGP